LAEPITTSLAPAPACASNGSLLPFPQAANAISAAAPTTATVVLILKFIRTVPSGLLFR